MNLKILGILLITSHCPSRGDAIGIDGKLDFGTSHSAVSSLRSEHGDNQNGFTPFKYSKTTKSSSDDFENIGVVCVSGGCNTTKITSTNNNTGDTIQTDVLVHVHTTVDFNRNKTESVGETPDIPIVIGHGGSELDITDDKFNSALNPPSIFLPDVPEIPTYTSSFDSTFDQPSVGSRIDSVNPFEGLDRSANPSGSRSGIGGFYVTRPPGSSISRSFDNLNPSTQSGFYPIKPDRHFNEQPSSIPFGGSENDRDLRYKENGIEIKIPYFDQTYHNHYYGERPPPQYIWYAKKSNGFNPVEFKTTKSTWTPSLWNRKVIPHRHGSGIGDIGVKCSCKENDSGSTTGVRWYPATSRTSPSINDPGAQINDKLAPLN